MCHPQLSRFSLPLGGTILLSASEPAWVAVNKETTDAILTPMPGRVLVAENGITMLAVKRTKTAPTKRSAVGPDRSSRRAARFSQPNSLRAPAAIDTADSARLGRTRTGKQRQIRAGGG